MGGVGEAMGEYARLREQLRDAVRRVVAGGPLRPLREWVEAYDAPISACPDPTLRELLSDVWAVLSEGDLGELDDRGVRARLAALGEPGDVGEAAAVPAARPAR